jgi:hypothetical protein
VKKIALAAIAASMFLGGATMAFAQTEERLRQGVLDRDRPAFQAVGIRMGSFLVYPAVDVSMIFDDNIFATGAGVSESDDVFVRTKPQVAIESNFPRHALDVNMSLTNDTYFDSASEDRTDYFVQGTGRLDIVDTTNFRVDMQFEEDTQDRGSPDAAGAAADPVDFTRFQTVGELSHNPGRLRASVGGIYQDYDYDDVGLVGGGVQNNDDRDRERYGVFGRVGYEVSPGYELFALGIYTETDYDSPLDDNGFNRDNENYSVEGGARFEVTNVIAGEVGIGYTTTDYDDMALGKAKGVAANADIEWYVTRLTTILLGASRRAQETTITGASAYLDTNLDVGVDHELMRNVILSAYFRYNNRDYKGIGREDDIYEASLRANYLINRNFSIAAEYRYRDRDSNVLGADYSRNIVGVTLRAQL